MSQRIQLRVSRFCQIFWGGWAVLAATFAGGSLLATLRLAAQPNVTGLERAAPLLALALIASLVWFFWLRLVPEFRPAGELALSGDELVVSAPPFLREPLRVPRECVRAGAIDRPQRAVRSATTALSVSAISAKTSEGFGISALVLHSSWPNLALFFDPPVELPRPRLRARLLFPRRVGALLAQVVDPAHAAAAFAPWDLPLPDQSELTSRQPPRHVRIARSAKFTLLSIAFGGSFAGLVLVGLWAGRA